MLIETLLKAGENFATFIRITELNITAVSQNDNFGSGSSLALL
jgi:hypothetical protein